MSSQTFENQVMKGTVSHNVDLQNAEFNDVALGGAKFENVSLVGAHFNDVNLKDAVIADACIDGLTIWGFDIHALIDAEQKRQKATAETE